MGGKKRGAQLGGKIPTDLDRGGKAKTELQRRRQQAQQKEGEIKENKPVFTFWGERTTFLFGEKGQVF